MKRVILVLIAILTLSAGAFAQRRSVPYSGIGLVTNFRSADSGRTGPALLAGFRNYNRNSFITFGGGAEVLGYFVPSRPRSEFGVFVVPEIGLGIGPSFFKVYPHTGVMLGYNNWEGSFGWGGKDGIAFDIGRHFTVDVSTYLPRYKFSSALYAVNFIWRF